MPSRDPSAARLQRWRPPAFLAPVLLGIVLLAAFFGRLLHPTIALATRDIARYHLPLRTDLARLIRGGIPYWNPWLHGGQPLLSNPGYSAFYPPSWIGLLIEPSYALNLLVLFHAAVAFAGAWFLAHRLGAGRPAAALAAVGFAGSGVFISLLDAFTLFTSMAWFPWVLAWGDAAFRARGGWKGRDGWLRPALLSGLALGLQLLNGEPVTVVISGLGLASFALSAAGRRPRALARGAVPIVAALLLAAVQILPTRQRLADSPRSEALPYATATTWSIPPTRLAELVFPRFFGDPTRAEEGLFFGWRLNDRNFPYVVSLYPGLLLTLLGLTALVLWPIPRRAAWGAAFLGGLFLALGRNNPLYGLALHYLPLLGILRYPEKFIILSVSALLFAGALGWQRLLEERRRGRTAPFDFPLALSLLALAVAGLLAITLHLVPKTADPLIRSGLPFRAPPPVLLRARSLLETEAWAALGTTLAVTALLALGRWRRIKTSWLSALAVLLLLGDLWHYDHRLVEVMPASELRDPPPLARQIPTGSRVFTEPDSSAGPELVLPRGKPGLWSLRTDLEGLEPYAGNLWGVSYALNTDYDLMLTSTARRALGTLGEIEGNHEAFLRFLGAWNVGTLVVPRPFEELRKERRAGTEGPPSRALPNPFLLPRYRFVPQVEIHPDIDSALAAARNDGFELFRLEHWIEPGTPPRLSPRVARPALLEVDQGGSRIDVRYRATEEAFFVAAVTFDPGWRARVDGRRLAIHPTAAGQMGMVLPPGERTLHLVYRDPWVPVGAAVSGAALLGLLTLLVVSGRRETIEPT